MSLDPKALKSALAQWFNSLPCGGIGKEHFDALLAIVDVPTSSHNLQGTPAYHRGSFETEYGKFFTDEEVIYIAPNGKGWRGIIGEVLPDGEADFVSSEWSRSGTYKWRFFRKLPAPPPPAAVRAEPNAIRSAIIGALYGANVSRPESTEELLGSLIVLAGHAFAHPSTIRAETIEALRSQGWMVAVHNDYRLNGEFHTFWLMTHGDGRYIKGEGKSDDEAIAALRSLALEDGR